MIQALIGPATKLLGKFIEDKDTKNKIAFELSTMAEKHAQQLALAQIELNKAEAQSGSLFKGGLDRDWETKANLFLVSLSSINFPSNLVAGPINA